MLLRCSVQFLSSRLVTDHWQGIANKLNKVWKEGIPASFSREPRIPNFCHLYPAYRSLFQYRIHVKILANPASQEAD